MVAHGTANKRSVFSGILMDKMIIVEDCQKSALLTEGSAVAATRMLGLVLLVVRNILEASDSQQAASVPEPMVRDVVNYASFVITSGAPDLFAASKDLHTSMLVRQLLMNNYNVVYRCRSIKHAHCLTTRTLVQCGGAAIGFSTIPWAAV